MLSGDGAGLQNQSGDRKVPGGFDSLPSPPLAGKQRTELTNGAEKKFRGQCSTLLLPAEFALSCMG
jgi:hypothetical protein